MIHRFKDRNEAGELLANHLKDRFDSKDTVVVAIPRGGLAVALPIAKELNAPVK